MAHLSRRAFLQRGAVVAGASALSFNQLFGANRLLGQTAGDDPQTILNLAATAETFACVHYFTALQSADALGLSDQEIGWLRAFLDAELQHKLFLEANGAQALTTEFFVPAALFSDRAVFVETTNTAENWFVAAYLAATRRFAELGEPLLAATTAQVSGVEAEHQALIRLMGGLQPSFQTLKEPLFWNTSEVVPLFTPFLEGGDGFVGPAAYPGDAAIQDAVAGMGVAAVTPFIQLNGTGTLNSQGGMMDAMATADATDAMTMGAVTLSGSNTIVRTAPSTNASQAGSLTQGQPMEIIGQTTGDDGFVWYQIGMGWVRADVVTVTGDVSTVPTTTP